MRPGRHLLRGPVARRRRRRGRIMAPGFLAMGALAVALACGEKKAPPPPTRTSSAPALSQAEKDRIRAFWATYGKARDLKLTGKWEEAIPIYRQALDLDPRHEDTLYGLANCHFELDQFEEALKALQRLVEVNPMSHRGYDQMGAVHACPLGTDTFDLAAAETALNRAIEINPEESGALLRLGELVLVKGDEERAFKLLALANQSNFRAVEGYYLRAYMRWKEKRLEESRDLLSEAVRQSKKPKVVAGVPGEGDTKEGSVLPPTTVAEKVLVKACWSGLLKRFPDEKIETEALGAEFASLDSYLKQLRARLVGTGTSTQVQ